MVLGLNVVRTISNLMYEMPGPDATVEDWQQWLIHKAETYEHIAVQHRALAAEAAGYAHTARLEAAAYTPVKAGAACQQPQPETTWTTRDREKSP